MADKAKTEVFDHGKGMVIIMKKEYTMNFNMGSCSWEPVCVHAALQIGADDTGDLMPLFHNFTVEDAPDMRYGVGGISSKILSISNKKILKDGKTAEFYVSIIPPTSSAERDRMIKIIGDQMSFALKVTLNPATGFLPGAPVSVVNSMIKSTSGTVTILLTLPPDKIAVDPNDDPLIIETNIEKTVSIRPTCERINFETLQYEIMRDAAGKPILPLLSMKSPIKEKKLPLKYELTEKDGLTIVDLSPVRFLVGDGTPATVFDIQIKRPAVLQKTEPELLKKSIHCTTNPLETEFRIMKGNKEMFRETKHVYGDLLDVKVVSEDSNIKWDDMTLLYQINNAGAFFNKSHFDTGKFSLKDTQELEINIIRNKEDANTRDSVTLEIKAQPFSGILHVFKQGWKLLDDDIGNILPDAGGTLEERLTGKVCLPYGQFLGYRKGPDGLPEIEPAEAETVRKIYKLFIGGKSTSFIAKYLTQKEIPTPGGKAKWQIRTIESILTNEKYKGSALLQKTFTLDFLTKKVKTNEGEVPQYYVEDSHPAIIEPEEWEKVQTEMKRRKSNPRRHNCQSPFSSKIICGDCGEYYGSKVWHSTNQYRRVIWQCNGKFKGKEKCRTPHLTEDHIKDYFVIALSTLLKNREALLEDGRVVKDKLSDCSSIDTKIDKILQEMDVVSGLIKKCIDDNSSQTLDQESYAKRYDGLIERYEALKNKHAGYTREREERQFKADVLSGFLFEITELDCLDIAFDEKHWTRTIDHVTVYSDERLIFSFQNGSEIEVEL